MSNDDDIERLLREIDGVTGSPAQPPAKRQESAPATKESSGGEMTVLVISAVIGIVGLLLGFLPLVPGLWLGLGGFLGSFLGLTAYRRFG